MPFFSAISASKNRHDLRNVKMTVDPTWLVTILRLEHMPHAERLYWKRTITGNSLTSVCGLRPVSALDGPTSLLRIEDLHQPTVNVAGDGTGMAGCVTVDEGNNRPENRPLVGYCPQLTCVDC